MAPNLLNLDDIFVVFAAVILILLMPKLYVHRLPLAFNRACALVLDLFTFFVSNPVTLEKEPQLIL